MTYRCGQRCAESEGVREFGIEAITSTSTCSRFHQVGASIRCRPAATAPVWRADGQELFYLAPDATIVAVPVMRSPAFAAGSAERLFSTRATMPGYGAPIARFNVYASARDGRRFLVALPQPSGAAPLTVTVNWLAAPAGVGVMFGQKASVEVGREPHATIGVTSRRIQVDDADVVSVASDTTGF